MFSFFNENPFKVTLCKQRFQGHPTDRFGGISVRKTCNRLKFSVREMSSRAFLINVFCFRRDKIDVLGTKIGQLGFSERQEDLRFSGNGQKSPNKFGKTTVLLTVPLE